MSNICSLFKNTIETQDVELKVCHNISLITTVKKKIGTCHFIYVFMYVYMHPCMYLFYRNVLKRFKNVFGRLNDGPPRIYSCPNLQNL